MAQRREQPDPAEAAGCGRALVAMVHRAADGRSACAPSGAAGTSSAASASIGRAKRKPWPSSQPRSRSALPLLGQLDALGDDLERERLAERDDRAGEAAASGVAPSRRNERSILRMSTGKRLR